MSYIKYLFSDKKALPYWAVLYIPLLSIIIIGIIVYIRSNQPFEYDPVGSLVMFFWTFSFILYYTPGYFNLKRQEKFLEKYANVIDENSIRKSQVQISLASYSVTALRTNYYATIKSKSRLENFTTLRIENKICIIGFSYEFGLLRKDIPPIIIDNDSNNQKKYSYAKMPKILSIDWIENDMEVIFERPVYWITKIKLIGWKNDFETNSR